METETDKFRHLQKFGAKGYIFFSMKLIDTPEHQQIVEDFKRFALTQTDDNYFLALKKLMEYYNADAKYNVLAEDVITLKDRVSALESKTPEPESKPEDDELGGTF